MYQPADYARYPKTEIKRKWGNIHQAYFARINNRRPAGSRKKQPAPTGQQTG